jgi:hypothetical protein
MSLRDQMAALDAMIKRPPTNSRVIEFSPELAEYAFGVVVRKP